MTSVKTRYLTRKRLFVQKRKIVNQRINRPVMVVRRKMIKERQVFERIIPKIIETREIINNPSVKSKVIEGPIYEITTIAAAVVKVDEHRNQVIGDVEPEVPEVELNPNSVEPAEVDNDPALGI